jgi:hypothetical protein
MVVHRRGGKTFAAIQDLMLRSLTHQRPGPPLRYAYVAPTRAQAKDITWGYVQDFFCRIPGTEANQSDLQVTLHNKASLRLYSGDSYERMRGLYFDGVVVDEPADIDPQAWDRVIRPTLSDYGGWATFIGTPKGRNMFWKLWLAANNDPAWFTLMLKASESGIITQDELQDIRKTQSSDGYEQEYECSFSIGRPGAIYAKAIELARSEGRITENVQWFKELPVYSSFDVGAAYNQRCWLWQLCGDRINFLESLNGDAECNTPATWAARLRERQYSYGAHFIPHDAAAAHGGLWEEGLRTAGMIGVVPVPRQRDVWDGINLGLDSFPRSWFAVPRCETGLESLDAYHSKQETDGITIKDVPVHDWSSHGADAFSLAHQAIRAGLVKDRTAIAARPRNHGPSRVVVHGGYRGLKR